MTSRAKVLVRGISRSINDRTAVGGYLTVLSKDWKTVREEISPEWLKDGRNTVLFTIPTDASYALFGQERTYRNRSGC